MGYGCGDRGHGGADSLSGMCLISVLNSRRGRRGHSDPIYPLCVKDRMVL